MIEHDNYIIIIDNLQLQSQLLPCQKIIPAQWGPILHSGRYFSISDVKTSSKKESLLFYKCSSQNLYWIFYKF